LERSTDTYIERFSHLLTITNDIIVFTSPDLVDRLKALAKDRAGRTVIEPYELDQDRGAQIAAVMARPGYADTVDPKQRQNSESVGWTTTKAA